MRQPVEHIRQASALSADPTQRRKGTQRQKAAIIPRHAAKQSTQPVRQASTYSNHTVDVESLQVMPIPETRQVLATQLGNT